MENLQAEETTSTVMPMKTKGSKNNPFKGMAVEPEPDTLAEIKAPIDYHEYLLSLSLRELKDLQNEISRTIVNYEDRKRREALAALEAVARDNGFSLGELVGGGFPIYKKDKKSKGAPVAPKYRNPSNVSDTWSGRGRKPLWFDVALKGGKKVEDLLI